MLNKKSQIDVFADRLKVTTIKEYKQQLYLNR